MPTKHLTIGKTEDGKAVTLPIDAVTRSFGFIGFKGAGKTYAAGKLTEIFYDAGVPVVIVDPIGNWRGIRLSKTGKRASRFNIPVLGGQAGDCPLEHTAGAMVADLIVDRHSSALLDVSLFSKTKRLQFMTDFTEQFVHRKKIDTSPIHMIIEEAHKFAPQNAKGQERIVGAMEDIVRLGRNWGIGTTLVTQRPQSVNKEVLNMVEPLCVFQLVGKHERDAVKGWMEYVGADLKDMLASLPSLQPGDCYFWSPAWRRTFYKMRFDEKESYDLSETPRVGAKPVQLKPLTKKDLQALSDAMAAVIEKAAAEDPTKLKARVRQLEAERKQFVKQLEKGVPGAGLPASAMHASQKQTATAVAVAIRERDKFWRRQFDAALKAVAVARKKFASIEQLAQVNGALELQIAEPPPVDAVTSPARGRAQRQVAGPQRQLSPQPPTRSRTGAVSTTGHRIDSSGALPQRIVDAIAWWGAIGIPNPTRTQVGFVAKGRGGHFNNCLGSLRSLGDVIYPDGGRVALSEQGLSKANLPEDTPTFEDLIARVKAVLDGGLPHRILDAVIEHGTITRDDLAAAVGNTGGHFNNTVGKLRSLGVIRYPTRGEVCLGEAFDAFADVQ